ncbi:hypothetical protein PVAND_014803 [Polypedilum vanderplanki]|uniref:Chitin-binding type-2 domain-containing protein n=1 Tax=Polypedilum vanderplanki TaxID=319348 RepID=A0A9J6BA96_POLVA|nr:hypothetical protein PVAND_014803 [Polypedilum vanderplanki]
MLQILKCLSFLIVLSSSCGELITKFSDSQGHPCERLQEGQQWIQNPRGCAHYYYCVEYPDFIGYGECPKGNHFVESRQACSPIEEVQCEIDDNLWSATCDGNNAKKVPHPHSCSEYTVCIEDLQGDFQCPDGLHFSPYDQDCVEPSMALCRVNDVTCAHSVPFIPLFIPSSRQCSVYYVCYNDILNRYQCGPDHHFDIKTTWCLPEDEVDCQIENPLPDISDIPSQLSIDCSLHPNNSRIPHEESCKFWFWCSNNRSQLFWCGEGASFDTISRTCTVTEKATCINASEPEVTEQSTGAPTESPTESVAYDEEEKEMKILNTFPLPPVKSALIN